MRLRRDMTGQDVNSSVAVHRAMVTDDTEAILSFAVAASKSGQIALATLTAINGGAARALGSHVVVAADGRYCGYVSGGCVEAALAAEALEAIREGQDRTVRYGEGSPFMDIRLPCGGGITITIHLVRNIEVIESVLSSLRRREPARLIYRAAARDMELGNPALPSLSVGDYCVDYFPRTRVIVHGHAAESDAVQRMGEAAGYDIILLRPGLVNPVVQSADRFTAIILLHHDLDTEEPMLELALSSGAFYIGALGSKRTHARRLSRLEKKGYSATLCERIKAPVGIFGPTRDASSLALSILAEVASCRTLINHPEI